MQAPNNLMSRVARQAQGSHFQNRSAERDADFYLERRVRVSVASRTERGTENNDGVNRGMIHRTHAHDSEVRCPEGFSRIFWL